MVKQPGDVMARKVEDTESNASELDIEAIRARAYEISQRPGAGSPEENWHRAVEELNSEQGVPATRA
jgi:hypothetical protein